MKNFDYYAFRVEKAKNKVIEEIAFYEECPDSTLPFFKDYITYLKNRVGLNRVDNPHFRYDNFGNKQEIKKLDMDQYEKELDSIMYNKPWAKLGRIHKEIKIKEYISELDYPKKISADKIKNNRLLILESIIGGLTTKKFTKNKSVITYDQSKMKIEDISCIEYNENTRLYEIDWSS